MCSRGVASVCADPASRTSGSGSSATDALRAEARNLRLMIETRGAGCVPSMRSWRESFRKAVSQVWPS
jgi:hypothetical protein